MNIKITYNWLLDYLETDADPYEIQKYLSLSGPSIERVEKFEDDYIFDIEIISNRIDTASVVGIAQEAVAILPVFGKKARLKFDPLKHYPFEKIKNKEINKYQLTPKILQNNLCSRFSAIVLENVVLGPSPKFIQKRLQAAGIKVINNVVDISNYLMLTFGQPVHTFDYDLIRGNLMIMREAKKGEKITTLDGATVTLPGGDIVIEDKEGRLIDLCGIMGGLNTAINEKTKNVLLFVQTYNKTKIRKTIMTTGVRTVAATYFEKGLDEERVEPTLVYGVELLEKYAQGKVASKLIDLYPQPYKGKKLLTQYSFFEKLIGVKIEKQLINQILVNLGFKVKDKDSILEVEVPSYRKNDIAIPEDLVEEVARVWGYHKIPGNLPPPAYVEQPEDFKTLFKLTTKIKHFLKHLGLNEVINYSMISEKLLSKWGFDPKNHLRLKNTISQEIEYMRQSLLPSLWKNLQDNKGKKEIMKFFELAKVYLTDSDTLKAKKLPDEVYRLGIAVNTDYFDLKGIIEALFKELNIDQQLIEEINIVEKDNYYFTEIDLKILIDNSHLLPKYQPINPYATIKLDKTFEINEEINYQKIKKLAFQSKYLKKIEVVSLYQNKLTLRFYYSSDKKNLTEEEAKKELEKIKV
ncbi:MAG: phenylalanine--tRNA ligase subunit beta [Microgenomates group bacterium]